MDIAQVQEEINSAFSELLVPSARVLIRRLDPRDRPSGRKMGKLLAGKTWQSLTPEFLAAQWAAFCYLTPEAYRYYLPALLQTALRDFGNGPSLDLLHSVVFGLRPSFWSL